MIPPFPRAYLSLSEMGRKTLQTTSGHHCAGTGQRFSTRGKKGSAQSDGSLDICRVTRDPRGTMWVRQPQSHRDHGRAHSQVADEPKGHPLPLPPVGFRPGVGVSARAHCNTQKLAWALAGKQTNRNLLLTTLPRVPH